MRKIKQNMRLYAGKLRSLSGIDIPTSIPDHAYCSTADIRTETEIVRNYTRVIGYSFASPFQWVDENGNEQIKKLDGVVNVQK